MRSSKSSFFAGLIASVALLGAPGLSHAEFTVNPGWDLWDTQPGTTFVADSTEIPLQGVPLGTFDFGGAIGTQFVNGTDTIVRRTEPAIVSGAGETAVIDIEMVALQLRSVDPVDLSAFGGTGTEFIFVTLQEAVASTGIMSITFGEEPTGPPPTQPVHGTWESEINVAFDVRAGSLMGDILASDTLTLSSSNNFWSHLPPAGAVEIRGVNTFLNGQNRDTDFWPTSATGGLALVEESHPTGTRHLVRPTVPEPSSVVLVSLGGIGAAGVLGLRRRGRR